ncbi:MAG: AAA family ATPase [Lachnospiraceae bacterium]|nr:AAA family ATPase [Lachnospiraceae bacterium]
MDRDKLGEQIYELEREIAVLPQGSISKKNINGKDYFYHRISQYGKRVEKYIGFDELSSLKDQICKRKSLELELKELKAQYGVRIDVKKASKAPEYRTIVRVGRPLKALIEQADTLKRREIFVTLHDYICEKQSDKVFLLYGLRRTGKTTMIRQALAELSEEDFRRAAFIQVTSKDSIFDLFEDLKLLEKNEYKYVFIDEVTLLDDFIENAAIFSDIYVSSGMKIVLSGTDSLGFAFSKEQQLYDRCIMLHTTFIPYREFENVLGISGIDEYIRYGGTMSIGGVDYNKNTTFSDSKHAQEYIDTAIAKNIQHSLKLYQNGGHFRQLLELYEKGELTNVINRVVEDINHRFTKSVVERTFKSTDLAMTAGNLLRDREYPINIKEHLDEDMVTAGIMQVLELLNIEEQSISVEETHLTQIKEYLTLLDMIDDIDLEFAPKTVTRNSVTVITQPGIRYAQANAIVSNLLEDNKFLRLSIKERQRILGRLQSEICGRMMEDIVLLETKLANPDKKVFKLQFAVGEFDMVVFDSTTLTCRIYEIKHSKERTKEQIRHLEDAAKCSATVHDYGDIKGKYVVYRGPGMQFEGVEYLNVEEYLKGLSKV